MREGWALITLQAPLAFLCAIPTTRVPFIISKYSLSLDITIIYAPYFEFFINLDAAKNTVRLSLISFCMSINNWYISSCNSSRITCRNLKQLNYHFKHIASEIWWICRDDGSRSVPQVARWTGQLVTAGWVIADRWTMFCEVSS